MISPCSFSKEVRKSYFDIVDSPGPASYDTAVRTRSPGGYISQEKRNTNIHCKELEKVPSPMEYSPKYHYVAKKFH
jgi:hypothetical protein